MKRFRSLDGYYFFDEKLLPAKNPVFVEIGSWSGEHPIALYERYKKRKPKIIVYEASPDGFLKLRANVRNFPILISKRAVSDVKGEVEFYDYYIGNSSGLIKRRNRGHLRKVKVKSTTMSGVIKKGKLKKIDVLFMNCEGSEIKILDYLLDKEDIRQRIKQICVAFHAKKIYKEGVMLKMIDRMKAVGYEYHMRKIKGAYYGLFVLAGL